MNPSGLKAPSAPSQPLRRQVLVLTDKASIQNLLFLMKKLESENAADGSACAVAALTSGQRFEAVILDMRFARRRAGGEIHGIKNIQSAVMGKMLAITAEVTGPKTMDLLERYLTSGLPGSLLWLVSYRYRPRSS